MYYSFCSISSCADELFWLEVEAHRSCTWQQQEWAGLLQTPQDQRVVMAPTSLPAGCVAGVHLPRHSQLWHPYPSSASAVEPRCLCCILNAQKSCQYSWLCSVINFTFEYWADTNPLWWFSEVCWTRQRFVVWPVCIAPVIPVVTLFLCSVSSLAHIIRGPFVTCWILCDVKLILLKRHSASSCWCCNLFLLLFPIITVFYNH